MTRSSVSRERWFRIDDPAVLAVPIAECGEPLVDVRTLGLRVDESRGRIQQVSENPFLARQSVAERLVIAARHLPDGITLEIKEAWRPIAVQAEIHAHHLGELRAAHSDVPDADLAAMAARYVAPPDIVPPHSTGGAIDLVLIGADGRELDMGWAFNEPGAAAATESVEIGSAAQSNRSRLGDALGTAGFVNYPYEWWHWSYGDRYWAHDRGEAAIFGSR